MIVFYPFDSLFFKDGKPFDAGTDTIASGIFPPYPSTVYGALRGLLATYSKNIAESDVDNYPDNLKYREENDIENCGLNIYGIYLFKKNKFYFKVPYNIVIPKKSKKANFLYPSNKNNFSLIVSSENSDPLKEEYISWDYALEILINNSDVMKLDFEKNIYSPFLKTGIALKYEKGIVKEGNLYTARHYKLKPDWGIAVDFNIREFPNTPDKGVYKLGGEMRPVYFEKIEEVFYKKEEVLLKISEKILENKRFFLWLITPGIFKNGYLPDFVDKKSLKGIIKIDEEALEVSFISCQMDKPIYIGGFNILKKIPKPIYKAVPQGAIYFFKIKNEINKELILKFLKRYFSKPLDSKFKEFQKQGFGNALIGGW